jgi:transposase
MRVTTAFNRLLGLHAISVQRVEVGPHGVVIAVALRRRRGVCSRCGQLVEVSYDRRRRRWRHLDLEGRRCYLEAELRRLRCPDCGVRVEAVPFARRGARHTRAFEQLVAGLAQQLSASALQRLLRIGWATVGRVCARVVAELLSPARFEGLRRIAIDEVSYRRGHRYLTLVLDHDSGRVVWASEGARQKTSLDGFLAALGPERAAQIEAVSIDMAPGSYRGVSKGLPRAAICIDPFHVVRLCHRALEQVRRAKWKLHHRRRRTRRDRWLAGTRWALLTAAEHRSERQTTLIEQLEQTNRELYRAYLLKEQLRALFRLPDPSKAAALLDAWLAAAASCGLAPFERLAATLAGFRAGILHAVELGLTNARLEGLNARVRLLSHRSFGFHSAAPLIGLVYLCCGGLQLELPLR